MTTATTPNKPKGNLTTWILACSAVLVLLGLLSAFAPPMLVYGIATVLLIALGVTAPDQIRALALSLVTAVIIALWSGTLYQAILFNPQVMRSNGWSESTVRLLSAALGVFTGAVLAGGLLIAGLLVASEIMLTFAGAFGLKRTEAFKVLGSSSFGFQLPYLIIENGAATISKPKGVLSKIGGQGMVIVRPANAVVFERVGKVTQIVGPGTAYTKLYEFPKAIVQLRPRWIDLPSNAEAQTLDGISLKITGGVGARIEPAADRALREPLVTAVLDKSTDLRGGKIDGDFPVYKDSIFRAVYLPAGPDWEKTLAGAAVTTIRAAINSHRLEDIFGPPVRGMLPIAPGTPTVIQQIQTQALAQLQAFAPDWGIQVTGLDLRLSEAPTELRQRVLKRWEIAADQQDMLDKGEAEAVTMARVEDIRRGTFDAMVQTLNDAVARANATLGPSQALRFARVLETIAQAMSRDPTVALRYIESLDKLSRMPNARVVIAPPDTDVKLDQ